MPEWSTIYDRLEDAGIRPRVAGTPVPVSGGDISAAWRVETEVGDLFIKTGPMSALDMFAAEAAGLSALSQTGAIRVPQVIANGQSASDAFLALEWLEFESSDDHVESKFGEQLAQLHRSTADRYGWHRGNTVGLTPQHNAWTDNWVDFFREQLLSFQLKLARDNGFSGDLQEKGSQLLKRLPAYFVNRDTPPSLLHGDLWGGNWGCSNGVPIIFDPAVYYGDRETDLAMTRLFGGFGPEFYRAYESSWALQDGHHERQYLYQLYHVLNHLNLFGSGYLGKAISLMDKLL
jgi:protein-ribulosamine 3-kinase